MNRNCVFSDDFLSIWQRRSPFTYAKITPRIWSAHHTSCGHAASIPTLCHGTPDKFFIPASSVTSSRSRPSKKIIKQKFSINSIRCLSFRRRRGVGGNLLGIEVRVVILLRDWLRSHQVGQGTIESRALPLVDTAKHARDVALVVRVSFVFAFCFFFQFYFPIKCANKTELVKLTKNNGTKPSVGVVTYRILVGQPRLGVRERIPKQVTSAVNMSLSTLLEAAKFLEMQEQKEQQQRAAEAATSKTSPSQNNQKTPHLSTVLITSSEIAPNLLTLAQPQPQIQKEKQAEQQPVVSSTVNQPRRILHNSFDIMNPLVIDEASGAAEVKRKQPPMVFRAGTREVHNKLEKHRRAHLKECFDVLKKQLPQTQDEKKTSNLSILHSALRCIQSLKRKERELEHEMERLARDKIAAQQKLAVLKRDITSHYDNVDFSKILPEVVPTTTTTVQTVTSDEIKVEPVSSTSQNGGERIQIPLLPNKTQLSIASTQVSTIKEVTQPVQTTALSVLPVGYPVSQGLVLQKLAIVPKGLTELTPLVSTHFITQQQINGKVVPLVNAQYVMKPVVVVSRPS